MSELKITQNSLENAILKDGQLVFGSTIEGTNNIITSSSSGALASGYVYDSEISAYSFGAFANGYAVNNSSIIASGQGAHAEGYVDSGEINALGDGAHAEGYASSGIINASGQGAHAEGISTQALANGAHAGGYGTIANHEAMTAIGKYNNTSTNVYFVVGNGNSANSRNDAFVVDTGGNVQIGGSITKVNNVSINANVSIDGNITKVNNVSINANVSIGDSATAKVNNVNNVYLGCPIGTIVMWAGETAPEGWFLCDGSKILTYNKVNINQIIQDKNIQEGELSTLIHIMQINNKTPYGSFTTIYNDTSKYVKNYSTIEYDNIVMVTVTEWTESLVDASAFYLNSDKIYTFYDDNNNKIGITSYYTLLLPNFQQRFPLGADNASIGKDSSNLDNPYDISLGKTGGEDTHKLSIKEMPKITIYLADGTGTTTNVVDDKDTAPDPLTYSTSYVGEDKSHNNIPPYLAINFIIKYK